MPPKPKPLIPARRGVAVGHDSASRRIRSRAALVISSGWGWSQPVVGGRIRVCTAMVAFIKQAMPAAALVCPIFALIDPSAVGGEWDEPSRMARDKACNSVVSPIDVQVQYPSK